MEELQLLNAEDVAKILNLVPVKEQFIRQTKEIWQPHADHTLTEEDARQVIENVAGFFDILWEWEKCERRQNFS